MKRSMQASQLEKKLLSFPTSVLSDKAIISMLLVYWNMKPCCEFEFWAGVGCKYRYWEEFNRNIFRMKLLLDSIPILYSYTYGQENSDTGELNGDYASFCLAKDQESMDTIARLESVEDNEEYSMLYERALGHPETAIAASLNHTCFEHEELPEEVKDKTLSRFLLFPLSYAHWREEIAIIQTTRDMIRLHTPRVYERIVSD